MISTKALRQTFLDYFHRHGHTIVESAPLVPQNDATLLFTNAGMVPFKDVFLGNESRPYIRATSSQRCVRAGGKHNDLENVGYTARHHTFFEMLGNFSFGDYFKREAIQLAWKLLTQDFGLPPEKLWVTVFEKDDEAATIWLDEIKVDPTRFSRIGAKDNFWSMGDTGPCGPCSEIFYDHGPSIPGGPPGSPDEDGDRYIEIWNLVFMQYDRAADGTLTPLPRPSVDTGMGLERLAAVLQGVHSNYDIDLFRHLINAAVDVTRAVDVHSPSLKVIADHIRSTAFLIMDGVTPSNEGRGYVLRRILRRAIRHGHKLGVDRPFFHKLVVPLVHEMGEAFPELAQQTASIEQTIVQEEHRFAETLNHGMALLERDIAQLSGTVIAGETAFKLYDTYGFPLDLTADIARERGLTVDMAGFEAEMTQQRKRARAASQFSATTGLVIDNDSEFCGYQALTTTSQITTLFNADNQPVDGLKLGERGTVVLNTTPFYGESGGQIGDTGVIESDSNQFTVQDTRKQRGATLHVGTVAHGELRVGMTVTAKVDAARRHAIMLNHSSTHLLHAALREILGPHVAQKGSQVAPERLRFDFSHASPVTPDEMARIEQRINEEVRRNHPVAIEEMPIDDAMKRGAMALFGEKYGERVRVVTMGDFSVELCGGTHIQRTGDIGLFKLLSETGVASGIRRIEAVTGQTAFDFVNEQQHILRELSQLLKGDPLNKAAQLIERNKQLERDVERLKQRLASGQGVDLASTAIDIHGAKLIVTVLDDTDAKTLRSTVDQLKDQLKTAIVVLATVEAGKVKLAAGVSADYQKAVPAGDLVSFVASQVGGKGGGRADFAQAGGTDPDQLSAALAQVPDWVRARLS